MGVIIDAAASPLESESFRANPSYRLIGLSVTGGEEVVVFGVKFAPTRFGCAEPFEEESTLEVITLVAPLGVALRYASCARARSLATLSFSAITLGAAGKKSA